MALGRMVDRSCVDGWTFGAPRSGTWRQIDTAVRTDVDVDNFHAHSGVVAGVWLYEGKSGR